MSRRHIAFDCEGTRLIGTLDAGCETTALLIVTGGNEVRAGAWNGQAKFAARIASSGFPAFRFDRRGVGDTSDDLRQPCAAQGDVPSCPATAAG